MVCTTLLQLLVKDGAVTAVTYVAQQVRVFRSSLF
jgi:hypothetical protein